MRQSEQPKNENIKLSNQQRIQLCQYTDDSNYGAIVDYFRDTPQFKHMYRKPKFLVMKDSSKCAVDEDVICEDEGDIETYIGKIIELAEIEIGRKEMQFVKTRLFYTKSQMEKIVDLPEGLTDKDLFLTEKTKWFMLSYVIKKIDAHRLKDLDSGKVLISKWDERVYIHREDFNTETKQFQNSFEYWKRYCNCGEVYNPQEAYIECEKCFDWIHTKCSLLSDEQIKNVKSLNYLCFSCGGDPKKMNIKQDSFQSGRGRKKSSKSSKKDK